MRKAIQQQKSKHYTKVHCEKWNFPFSYIVQVRWKSYWTISIQKRYSSACDDTTEICNCTRNFFISALFFSADHRLTVLSFVNLSLSSPIWIVFSRTDAVSFFHSLLGWQLSTFSFIVHSSFSSIGKKKVNIHSILWVFPSSHFLETIWKTFSFSRKQSCPEKNYQNWEEEKKTA